ncbi:MAG TPA: S8 family peptidase [Gammaproteobacteria bacterium]|nr:S8 family peptidase [Gammaproteobacteria bacterium]
MHLKSLLLIALALTATHGAAWAGGNMHSGLVTRIVIKYKDSSGQKIQPAQRATVQHSRGRLHYAKVKTGDNGDVYYLDQPRSAGEARLIAKELMQRDDVEYAEPAYRRYPTAFIPNDPAYATEQWYLKPFTAERGAIDAQNAWDITRGDSSIVVAVIDTGILQHEDIAGGRVLPGYDFYSDTTLDNDDDPGIDNDPADPGDAVATNECPGDPHPAENSSWHGTLVSGVIIAETNSLVPQGIAGLDHHALILPIRALGKCGGDSIDIAEAIRWAADLHPTIDNPNPADVINLSLGAFGETCSLSEQAAIDEAVLAGVTVVVAAGNDGQVGQISSPANCDHVIAVAATSRDGAETCYTNVGSDVDLSAPGGNDRGHGCNGVVSNGLILSTSNKGTTNAGADAYEYVMGTSFSTPLVSGTVALMKAMDPGLPPDDVEAMLKNTARVFPTNTNDAYDDCTTSRCGAGILDANGAVTAARDGGVDSVPNPFSFNDKTGVALKTTVVSNRVTITGISSAPIRISGAGEYSIDGGSFTDADGTINGNQKVQVRLRSSGAHNTRLNTRLTIGGISDTFSVTTQGNSGGGGGGGEAAWLLPLLIGWRSRKRSAQ